MGKTKRKDSLDELPFESALQKLEEIVSELEEGDIGLSESLDRYETGIEFDKLKKNRNDAVVAREKLREDWSKAVDEKGKAVVHLAQCSQNAFELKQKRNEAIGVAQILDMKVEAERRRRAEEEKSQENTDQE